MRASLMPIVAPRASWLMSGPATVERYAPKKIPQHSSEIRLCPMRCPAAASTRKSCSAPYGLGLPKSMDSPSGTPRVSAAVPVEIGSP